MNKKFLLSTAFALLVMLVLSTTAHAQSSSVSGKISAASGEPPGRMVTLLYIEYEGQWIIQNGMTSEYNGTYKISNVLPGTYMLGAFDITEPILYPRYQFYGGGFSQEDATIFVVNEGEDLVNSDWTLLDDADPPTFPESAVTIEGAVTNAEGNPIKHAAVIAARDRGGEWIGVREAYTDINGRYRLQFEPFSEENNQVRIHFDHIDYIVEYYDNVTDPYSSELTLVEYNAGDVITDIDAVLEKFGQIRGTVTDDNGDPIAGVRVSNHYEYLEPDFWNEFNSTYTDESGAYRLLTDPLYDTYRVLFEQSSYATEYYDNVEDIESATDVFVAANMSVSDIDARLSKRSTISGRVTNPLGEAVSGADVTLLRFTPDSNYWSNSGEVTTDQEGSYLLEGVEPGIYKINVHPDFREDPAHISAYYGNTTDRDRATSITVAANEALADIDIQLDKRGKIEGFVTDENGSPIPDLYVLSYNRTRDDYWLQSGTAYTNEEGFYQLWTNPNGEVFHVRFGPEYTDNYPPDLGEDTPEYVAEYYDNAPERESAYAIYVTTNMSVSDIDAQLAGTATISGQITNPAGEVLRDAYIELFRFDSEYCCGWTTVARRTTGEDGRYLLQGVVPGTYRVGVGQLRTEDADYAPRYYGEVADIDSATSITITAQEVLTDINIQLIEAGRIEGTVTDERGVPLPDVSILSYYKVDHSGHWVGSNDTTTDANGFYQLWVEPEHTTYRIRIGPDLDRVYPTGEGEDPLTYAAEYYNDTQSLGAASDIVVTAGMVVSGIDAQLSDTATISGRVTNPSGDAVPNAGIQLFRIDPEPEDGGSIASRTTEQDGHYSLQGLLPGVYRLRVDFWYNDDPEYASEYYDNAYTSDDATDIIVAAGEVRNDIDIQVDSLGQIAGTVTDENGNPLPDVPVALFRQTYVTFGFIPAADTQTDANGNYIFTDLENSMPYRIRFGPDENDSTSTFGYHTEYFENAVNLSEATDINVVVGTTTNIDAQLTKASSISGLVTDSDGAPLSNIYVQLHERPYDHTNNRSTKTNANGEYTFHRLETDTYRVSFSGNQQYQTIYYEGAVHLEDGTNIFVDVGEDITGVDVQLSEFSTISGRITDVDGNPLSGSDVKIELYDKVERSYWSDQYVPYDIDQNGNYVITGIKDGTYRLGVANANYSIKRYQAEFYNDVLDVDSAEDIIVSDGDEIALEDISLLRLGSISGKVTDLLGNPVRGIGVRAYPNGDDENNSYTRYGATTDTDGTYRIGGVPADSYSIQFSENDDSSSNRYRTEYYNNSANRATATEVVVVTSEDVTGIDAELSPSYKLQGQITDEEGNPVPYMDLTLYTQKQPDGRLQETWRNYKSTSTDSAGNYLFGEETHNAILEAGIYRLCAHGGYNTYVEQCYGDTNDANIAADIVVGPNETVSDINLTLLKVGEIMGMVSEADGTPLEDVKVTAYRYHQQTETWVDTNHEDSAVITNAEGKYTVSELLPGIYRLRFTGSESYAEQFYFGAATLEDADYIEVASGQSITFVDVQLVQRTAIMGKVTDENGVPLDSIFVGVYAQADEAAAQAVIAPPNEIWNLIRSGTTNEDGEYAIYDLAHGIYRVRFNNAETLYHSEFYGDEAYYISQATDIVIGAETRVENIDAAMASISLNVPPLAVEDALLVDEAGEANELVDARRSLLANDQDVENATLTAELLEPPTHGTLDLSADGTFSYKHDGSETLSDGFVYVASDGTTTSDAISVTVTIQPQNDSPFAEADSISVKQGGATTILASGETSVLYNDSDADSEALSVLVDTEPTAGALMLNEDGTFSYEHDGSTTLTDSFTYVVSDGINVSAVTTVTISVQEIDTQPVDTEPVDTEPVDTEPVDTEPVDTEPVDTEPVDTEPVDTEPVDTEPDGTEPVDTEPVDTAPATIPPTAFEDTITVDQGGTADTLSTGNVSVMLNDNNAEDADLTVILVQEPEFGTLTLNANGSFIYQHNGDESTSDSFTYKVSNGEIDSAPATVTIQIAPVSTANLLYLPTVIR